MWKDPVVIMLALLTSAIPVTVLMAWILCKY